MKQKQFSLMAAGALTAALALTGCSGGSVDGSTDADSPSGEGDSELTNVQYGLFPSSTVAALEVAIEEGIFEEEGIDLELVVGAGSSAAQLPALSSGDLDFMLASPVTPISAAARGLDVKVVSGVTQNDPDVVEESTVVVVGKDSDIERPADLAGKTVSVNALGSVGEIGIREAVRLDGGDPSTIEFVQLSFPEVAAQVDSAQIDAGMTGSPFIQQVVGAGGQVVSDFIHETGLGGNELVTIAGGELIDEDPELVERFTTAMDEALSYMDEHNDEIRAKMPEALGTDPEAAEKAELSIYSSEIQDGTLQLFADLMSEYEVVETEVDADEFIWKP